MGMGNAATQNMFSRFNAGGNSEQFPDPFLDVASLAMPDNMRNALHWCTPPGTLIELGNGSLKPSEDVRRGDMVLTKGGTIETVERVGVRQVEEDLVVLQVDGLGKHFALRLTANHNMPRITTARLKPSRVTARLDPANIEKVPAGELKAGDYLVTSLPCRQQPRARTQPPDFPDHRSRYSGWLLGMYIAEGCPIFDRQGRLQGVRFSLGEDDEHSGVLQRLCRECALAVGREITAYTPPSRPDVRLVTVCDAELPDWLLEHGGRSAATKQVSWAVLSYEDDFLRDLLGGWIDGDGWVDTGNDRGYAGASGCSASFVLVYQLQRIANLLGLTPSLSSATNGAETTYGVPGGMLHNLEFGKTAALPLLSHSVKLANAQQAYGDAVNPRHAGRSSTFIRDGLVYRRIRVIQREAYRGPVYSFRVQHDHSYIANGLQVFNCEYIYSSFGTYRMAMERIVSYFLTDVEVGGDEVSDDEKEKYEDFLTNTIDAFTVLQNLLRDRMCYGNAFASIMVPFKRFLVSPSTGDMYPLKEVYKKAPFNFAWSNFEFVATDPKTKWRGPWRVKDISDDESKKIKVKRWSPHEIELLHDPLTDDVHYLWRIPEDYKKLVKDGNLFHLERVTEPIIKAIKNNQMFRFHPDVMFHMKEPTLAGISNRGWGIPRIISNFRQIYYVQVLRRFNEAIALDYVIPFRLITPEPQSRGQAGGLATGDPLMMFNGGDFRNQVQSMIRKRRRDPSGWNILPYPVKYSLLGGDAAQLAPRDLLDQGTETLLNDAGTPVELYKGSLQLQTAPVALRLFEATWHHLVHDTNAFLQWLVTQVSQIMSWEVVEASLKRVTIADDMNKQMAALQLMMGQQLSGKSGLGAMGFDWDTEQKRLAEESVKQQKIQSRMQEEMEQQGFAQQIAKGQGGAGGAGQQPGGGDPSQGGGQMAQAMGGGTQTPVSDYIQSMGPNVPVTPNDLMQTAEQIAQELLGKPEGIKDSELRKLKQYNEVLHSLVKAKMEATRQQARTQGGAQMMQQMQQGGGGGQ